MAGRKPYKPTQKDIDTVRQMKEKGASDKACSDAIGVSRFTFNKYKNQIFLQPIKEAAENRQNKLMEIFEDALPKQLTGYYVTEEIERINPVTGKFELAERKKKWMAPNATLMMYTSANKSNGEWQSINKVEQTTEINNTPTLKVEWTD